MARKLTREQVLEIMPGLKSKEVIAVFEITDDCPVKSWGRVILIYFLRDFLLRLDLDLNDGNYVAGGLVLFDSQNEVNIRFYEEWSKNLGLNTDVFKQITVECSENLGIICT